MISTTVRHELESNNAIRHAESETENLTSSGAWQELFLYEKVIYNACSCIAVTHWPMTYSIQGIADSANCKLVPTVCKLVEDLPEVASMVFGDVKLSIVQPGTHIAAHCGPTNMKLRLHLGLKIPANSGTSKLRVGDAEHKWEEGKTLVFDDSFEHEVAIRFRDQSVINLMLEPNAGAAQCHLTTCGPHR